MLAQIEGELNAPDRAVEGLVGEFGDDGSVQVWRWLPVESRLLCNNGSGVGSFYEGLHKIEQNVLRESFFHHGAHLCKSIFFAVLNCKYLQHYSRVEIIPVRGIAPPCLMQPHIYRPKKLMGWRKLMGWVLWVFVGKLRR